VFDTVRLQNSVVTLLKTSLFSGRIFTPRIHSLLNCCSLSVLLWFCLPGHGASNPEQDEHQCLITLETWKSVKTVLVSENTYCQPHVSSCNVCEEGGSVEVEDCQFLIGLLRRSYSVNSSTCVTLTSPETVEGQILHDALADCHIGPAQQTTLC
jgi:hypothetical protein